MCNKYYGTNLKFISNPKTENEFMANLKLFSQIAYTNKIRFMKNIDIAKVSKC